MLPYLILTLIINIWLIANSYKNNKKLSIMKVLLIASFIVLSSILVIELFIKKTLPNDEISQKNYQYLLLNACFNPEFSTVEKKEDFILRLHEDLSDQLITNTEFKTYTLKTPLLVPYGVAEGNLELAKTRIIELGDNVKNRIYMDENNIEINDENQMTAQSPIALCSSYGIRYAPTKRRTRSLI